MIQLFKESAARLGGAPDQGWALRRNISEEVPGALGTPIQGQTRQALGRSQCCPTEHGSAVLSEKSRFSKEMPNSDTTQYLHSLHAVWLGHSVVSDSLQSRGL